MLSKKLEECIEYRNELEDHLTAAENCIDEYKIDLKKCEEYNDELEDHLTAAENLIDKLKSENAELKQVNAQLKEQLFSQCSALQNKDKLYCALCNIKFKTPIELRNHKVNCTCDMEQDTLCCACQWWKISSYSTLFCYDSGTKMSNKFLLSRKEREDKWCKIKKNLKIRNLWKKLALDLDLTRYFKSSA